MSAGWHALLFSMEYADGGDFEEIIKVQKEGVIDGVAEHWQEAQIMAWFVQLTLALKHLHDRYSLFVPSAIVAQLQVGTWSHPIALGTAVHNSFTFWRLSAFLVQCSTQGWGQVGVFCLSVPFSAHAPSLAFAVP